MTPLELLKAAQGFKDLERNVSTATLLWVVCSVVAVTLKQFNFIGSYEPALPVIVLVTWIGTEITARMPTRVPVAVCETCYCLKMLPGGAFRRFWPWKRCTHCGGHLRYTCPNKHLLSLFDNEKTEGAKRLWCSRCGETPTALKEKELLEQMHLVAKQRPKGFDDQLELVKLIWRLIRGTGLQSEIEKVLDRFVMQFLLEHRQDRRKYDQFLYSIGFRTGGYNLSIEERRRIYGDRKRGSELLDQLLVTDLKEK